MEKTSIFISYQRSDASNLSGRIYDYLTSQFPDDRVFMDAESIAPGEDVPARISEAVEECSVFLALIGSGRFPESINTDDYFLRELRFAIAAGKPIFPVLLAGAEHPSRHSIPEDVSLIADLRSTEIRSGIEFREDIRVLTRAIREEIRKQSNKTAASPDVSDNQENQLTRELRVFMYTDIEGSKALTQNLGDSDYQQHVLSPHDTLFRAVLKDFPHPRTTFERDQGDGFFMTFQLATDAVIFALRFQHQLRNYPWTRSQPLVRIGIHVGEVFVTPDRKYSGVVINEASCLCALAQGGQTLVSQAVRDSTQNLIRSELEMPNDGRVQIHWQRHGNYVIDGSDHDIEIIEVGEMNQAPFTVPQDTKSAKRRANELGPWVPVAGEVVPGREPYVLDHEIGRGGFGEVWIARKRYAQPLVFKFCSDVGRLRSFKREWGFFHIIQKKFGDHEGIAKIGAVQHELPPYYVEYEYIDGGDLRQWAREHGGLASFELDERVEIVACVAQTIADAHSVGIVHRDIKPDNILMSRDQEGNWRPKLTDFGIASLTKPPTEMDFTGVTAENLVNVHSDRTGTPMYRPPESFRSQFIADAKALMQGDVYSLGVVLYQLIVQDFEAIPTADWKKHVTDDLLRDDLEACLSDDLSQRLYDPHQLADRLRRLPERRKRRDAEDRARLLSKRRRMSTTVFVVLLITLFAAAGSIQFLRQQRDRAQAAERLANSAEKQAAGVVREFLVRFGEEQLRARPGSHLLREQALDKALTYYEDLLKRPKGYVPETEIAEAYYFQGLIHELKNEAMRAIELYERALDHVGENPINSEMQVQRGKTLTALGRVYNRLATDEPDKQCNFISAEDYYKRALAVRKEVAEKYGTTENLRLLANAKMHLGQLYLRMIEKKHRGENNRDADKRLLDESQEIRRSNLPTEFISWKSADELPESFLSSRASLDLYRDYALGLLNQAVAGDGQVEQSTGTTADKFEPEPLLEAEQMFNVLLQVKGTQIDRTDIKFCMAKAHFYLGRGRHEGIPWLVKLITNLESLSAENPDVTDYKKLLAKGWTELGMWQKWQMNEGAALLSFSNAEFLLASIGDGETKRLLRNIRAEKNTQQIAYIVDLAEFQYDKLKDVLGAGRSIEGIVQQLSGSVPMDNDSRLKLGRLELQLGRTESGLKRLTFGAIFLMGYPVLRP